MQAISRLLRSEPGQLALMMLFIFAARSSLADHYHVPTGSMEYTLMSGDRVVVDKTAYGVRIPFTKIDVVATGAPQAGDVAVFDSPETGILLIKRIVAVAGDRVKLVDGHVWLNGQYLAMAGDAATEQFGDLQVSLNLSHGGGPAVNELVVPANMVLAIGDHRGNSHDSRYFGFIHQRELYGRAVGTYYSRKEGFHWQRL